LTKLASDWYENFKGHRSASLAYLARKHGLTLNSHLEEETKKKDYWRQVLECVKMETTWDY
jgi:hypothetical protein